jgi:hypothetical protein
LKGIAMLVNEYTLVISSGSATSEIFQAGRAEYYAGFSCSSNFGGNITLEESFYPTGPFRLVYTVDDKQLKWTTHGSGIFVRAADGAYHPYIRFVLSSALTKNGAIYLRTVED